MTVIWVILVSSLSALGAFFIAKKMDKAKYDLYVEQAKAKAKAIEYEADKLLENAKSKAKELELEAKNSYELQKIELQKEYEAKLNEILKKEDEIEKLIQAQMEKKEEIAQKEKALQKEEILLQKQKELYNQKLDEVQKILENAAGLTKEEAREVILKKTEESLREEIAHLTRKMLKEAENEAQRKANFIIAQATTRYAGDFAGERLINVVAIGDDEMKGRIIGKEGKNIKTLEMVTGCDIIIDETPGIITVSSFNIYRRQIAVETIKRLIEDGRIHPARIEEVYKKVEEEYEEKIAKEGEEILIDLGLSGAGIHPEIVKLIGRLRYRASYGQNALGHSLEVAHLAGIMAAEMGGDELLAKRAGILHDIGKALTHDFGGDHVSLGYDICKRYGEPEAVLNAIKAHHGHEEPTSIEAAAVCTADALSAARPGARREVLEAFLKRVKQLEEIATSFEGVIKAYALNAGRELRVIVEADLISDDEAVLLSREIAKRIEEEVTFPGEIKVNVIREKRAISKAVA
ncbi:ribonuclease Y [Caminibacter pacificus]|jgi:ribonuclease Y|uniref:Ribonuclease Y n=2 Tax=Caminibacter pacificus TaxID=1424653 RepID=A0ABX5TJY9_9BACT|nr:ribonuclease Y [Caminibacter pacificus]NPA87571.1 ribonuclease Y [Campylobacterota bacterium]QCI27753.1 ribonuclease Y [Caminibacter pacificus]